MQISGQGENISPNTIILLVSLKWQQNSKQSPQNKASNQKENKRSNFGQTSREVSRVYPFGSGKRNSGLHRRMTGIWAWTHAGTLTHMHTPIMSSFSVRAARWLRAYLWTFGNIYLALIYWINLKVSVDVSRLKASSVPAGKGGAKAPRWVWADGCRKSRPTWRRRPTRDERQRKFKGRRSSSPSTEGRHHRNAYSHTCLCSSCLSSKGTQEIQSEWNKMRRGIESLADAKNFPRPLRPGVLGM